MDRLLDHHVGTPGGGRGADPRFLMLILATCLAPAILPPDRCAAATREIPASGYILMRWEAESFGRRVGGLCCWARADDGAARLEIARAPSASADPLADLLAQRGEGWTLVLGAPGEGAYGAWGEPWRIPSAGLQAWSRELLVRSANDPGTPDRIERSAGIPAPRFLVRRHSASRVTVQRWIAPRLELDGGTHDNRRRGFRERMVHRGAGRGADEEIARLEIRTRIPGSSEEREGSRYRLSSSRRPGSLSWTIVAVSPREVPDLVFAPLWPLAEFGVDTRDFSGTRSTPGGYEPPLAPEPRSRR